MEEEKRLISDAIDVPEANDDRALDILGVQPPLSGPCKMLVQQGNGRLI